MIIDLLQKSRQQQRTRRVFGSSWKMHCVANHCRNVSLTIISSKLIRRRLFLICFPKKQSKESGLSSLKPQNMAEWKWCPVIHPSIIPWFYQRSEAWGQQRPNHVLCVFPSFVLWFCTRVWCSSRIQSQYYHSHNKSEHRGLPVSLISLFLLFP